MYNVNIIILIKWLLPRFYRATIITAFLKSLCTTIQLLFTRLKNFRETKAFELSVTSQVMWLEEMLNQRFDPGMRRIFIDEEYQDVRVIAYNKSEGLHPPYIYNKQENVKVYLRNKSETGYNYYFVVWVPELLYNLLLVSNESKLNLMKALLNKYKCYGTRYLIKPYH